MKVELIVRSPHPDAFIPENVSFPDFLIEKMKHFADKIAVVRIQSLKNLFRKLSVQTATKKEKLRIKKDT